MRIIVISILLTAANCQEVPAVGSEYNTKENDGSYRFGYQTGDVGAHYHAAVATRDNQVVGRFGSRDPSTRNIVETQYTSGRRGFRARGPNIARKMDLSQNKIPYNPPVNPNSPNYNPTYDGYHDPNEDPSYEFGFRTPVYSRNEKANSIGFVKGEYSFLDDVGQRHDVEYEAGAKSGFKVLSPFPDSTPFTSNSFYRGRPSKPGGKTLRGTTSIQQRGDGSYSFVSTGPDQRRTETSDPSGNVRGSYTYLDDKGQQRTVEYMAGPNIGYRVIKKGKGPNFGPAFPFTPTPGGLQPFPDRGPNRPNFPPVSTGDLFGEGNSNVLGGGGGNRPVGGGDSSPGGSGDSDSFGGSDSGSSDDFGRPTGSDFNRPSGGDFGRPSGSDFNRPSGGDFNRPSGSDFNRPSGGDFNRPSGSDFNRPTGGDFGRPSGGDFSRPTGGSSSGSGEVTPGSFVPSTDDDFLNNYPSIPGGKPTGPGIPTGSGGNVPFQGYPSGRPPTGSPTLPPSNNFPSDLPNNCCRQPGVPDTRPSSPGSAGGGQDSAFPEDSSTRPPRPSLPSPQEDNFLNIPFDKLPPKHFNDFNYYKPLTTAKPSLDKGDDSTFLSSNKNYYGFPHGIAIRAHVQSLDILPFGSRIPPPSVALESLSPHG